MDIGRANQAHLGRRAELAGTGLPGPTDVHNRKKFWGINYCSTHKKASKNPQFVDMFFRGYFRCLLELCGLLVLYLTVSLGAQLCRGSIMLGLNCVGAQFYQGLNYVWGSIMSEPLFKHNVDRW